MTLPRDPDSLSRERWMQVVYAPVASEKASLDTLGFIASKRAPGRYYRFVSRGGVAEADSEIKDFVISGLRVRWRVVAPARNRRPRRLRQTASP